MRHRLSLSGEIPPAPIMEQFEGVGLIRSEYLVRSQGKFITRPEVQHHLAEYLRAVAAVCPSGPIWYRTSELTSQEANTLDGVDRIYHEADFMKGRRGIRRALELPEAFETELRVVGEVARDHPNLHVLLPFVRDAADLSFATEMLERVGWPNRFGSMIEIPSAVLEADKLVALGATNLMLGLNDLSSLLTGTSRQDQDMKLHPSVWWAVETLREAAGSAADWGLAGNFSPSVLERVRISDVPYISMHYNELPELLGVPADQLPEIGFVKHIKAYTRAQIRIAEDRDFAARQAALVMAENNRPAGTGP
jgi:phosphoenolpyruvate-protein kinase (PTS system EI component)